MLAELPESNEPTELWDGKIIVSPSTSFFHQELVDRFHDHLKRWVRSHQLGKTAVAPLDMVLSPNQAAQPDVIFISSRRLEIVQNGRVRGPADLVAEVISPQSRRRDRIDKHDLYERHGVREYWLIDPETRTVEVFHLDAGTYQMVGRWQSGEMAVSRLLPGFEVPVTALFGETPSGI